MAKKSAAKKEKDAVQQRAATPELLKTVPQVELKDGPVRKYIVSDPTPELFHFRTIGSKSDGILMAIVALFAIVTRFYDIGFPKAIVYDEGFVIAEVSKYFNKTFSIDVFPPLGKMIYYFVGKYTGFDTSYKYHPVGTQFENASVYLPERYLAAGLGACVVVFFFMTLRASGVSRPIAGIFSVALSLENSFITASRYVHLDAPFLFFVAAAIYFTKKSDNLRAGSGRYIFTFTHAACLLGLAISTKWAGLFVLAWVAIVTLWRLWLLAGDLSVPICRTVKVFIFNLLVLSLVPAVIYFSIFSWHIGSRTVDGNDSILMKPEFRSELYNNTVIKESFADVVVGGTVRLNNIGMDGGFVEAAPAYYEAGSKQRQIDLRKNESVTTDWVVEYYNRSGSTPKSFENLKNHEKIRLYSPKYKCRLHSHDHKAPISQHVDWQKEVSCYGYEGFMGDPNDDWIVEIDQDLSEPGEAREFVKAIDTKFRLKHAMSGCYLFTHDVRMRTPEFVMDYEIACAHSGKYELTLWNIEQDQPHPNSPKNPKRVSYKPMSLKDKILDLHAKMIEKAKVRTDKSSLITFPTTWPLLEKGIPFWNGFARQIYFLGNPAMWWSVSAFIVLFVVAFVGELIFWQMGFEISSNPQFINFHIQVLQYGIGFALNYVPYILTTDRHHLYQYLPAYYFGLLALAHVFELVYSFAFKNKRVGLSVAAFFLVVVVVAFFRYLPLTYATPWTVSECNATKLLSSWKYGCEIYPENYRIYQKMDLTNYTKAGTKELDKIGVVLH
ncbi:MIR domain profile [Nakaseomyces glabratus]|nr:MIR domain profile [Nakaseomyces glabratus]KAH7595142.1 MIR domain profile [Nakaseomyces glabratus]KAH7611226.1 MIR domain profile [Nakaseomyces glabratus]